MKDSQKFLSVVLGTGLMVLCCAGPIALVLFGTAGLAALAGYLDYLLFAVLAIVIGLSQLHPFQIGHGTHKSWRPADDPTTYAQSRSSFFCMHTLTAHTHTK